MILTVLAAPQIGSADPSQPEPDTADFRELVGEPPFGGHQPPKPAEVEQSQSEYENLSDTEALEVAQDAFPQILENTLVPELSLHKGEEVQSYPDAFTALIDIPGSEASLLAESTTPVRAPEGGGLRPLDASLETNGDHFQVENAPIEARISEHVTEGLSIGGTGVDVALADSSGPPVEAEDKVFYPNTGADTDILVAPTPFGAEVSYQLRSASSPARLELDFSMPPGSELSEAPDGSARIRGAAGDELITISAPHAWDAAGRDVDVSYSVDGNRLALDVEHRAEDVLYPVMVDPAIESYYQLGWNQNIEYWSWNNPSGSPGFTWSREVDGLQQAARGGYNYPWTASYFRVDSIRQSFIERMDFYNFYRYSGNPAACTIAGIYSPQVGDFEPGIGNNNRAVAALCDPVNSSIDHASVNVCVGWDCNAENWVYDSVGHNGNYGYFGVLTAGYRYNTAYNRLRSTTIYRYDYNNPTVALSGASPLQRWQDDSEYPEHSVGFTAYDPGLGIKSVTLDGTGPGSLGSVIRSLPCTGRREAQCGTGWTSSIPYQLHEGRRTLTMRSKDIIGHTSAPVTFERRIDRTAPTIASTAGSLKSDAPNLLSTIPYELSVVAEDGSTASPAQERSGVESIELLADGQLITGVDDETGEPVSMRVDQSHLCNASLRQCPSTMSHTFVVPPFAIPEDTEQVQVVAKDALGHRTWSGAYPIDTVVRSDVDEPEVQLSATPADQDGYFTLTFDATDGHPAASPQVQPYGSGVRRAEVYLDGQHVDTFEQPCAQGGCPMRRTVPLSGSGGLDEHEAVVIVYDKGGESHARSVGKKNASIPRYGFNGGVGPRTPPNDPETPEDESAVTDYGDIQRAVEGGANIVRFPLPWCTLVENHPVGGDPANWNWGGADFLLNSLRTWNADHPAAQIKALPAVISAPVAVDDPASEDPAAKVYDCPERVEPPTAEQMPEWRNMIGEILERYGPQHDNPDTAQVSQGEVGVENSALLGIEIWNEPNLPPFWGGEWGQKPKPWNGEQPERFAGLVNSAHNEYVERGLDTGTGVRLIPGGLSPDGDDVKKYATDAFSAITPRSSVDAISIHLYANLSSNVERAIKKINRNYDELVAGLDAADGSGNAFVDTDRWITEIGFPGADIFDPAAPSNATERTQRKKLKEAFLRFAMVKKVKAFLVHTFYDFTNETRSETNKWGMWRAVPETPRGTAVQCNDGLDNDGKNSKDNDDDPLTTTVVEHPETIDDPNCVGPFDIWENDVRPEYTPKLSYCVIGKLAGREANPYTSTELSCAE